MPKAVPRHSHNNRVIMGAMASQITSRTIVYPTVYSGLDRRNHQSSASLAFVRWPVNPPYKEPVTRKMFPFDDVIMMIIDLINASCSADVTSYRRENAKWTHGGRANMKTAFPDVRISSYTGRTDLDMVYRQLLLYRRSPSIYKLTLHWRHNDHDGVSNHQPHGCLLDCLFGRRSKTTPKLRVTGLCARNSPGPVNSPQKGPVTRKMFPFDDVIMLKLKSHKSCWSMASIDNSFPNCAPCTMVILTCSL